MTRPEGYRKNQLPKRSVSYTGRCTANIRHLSAPVFEDRWMYNRTEEYIEKLEKEGNIFVLRPEMKPVSRLEKIIDKLMAFYDHGYEMMKKRAS